MLAFSFELRTNFLFSLYLSKKRLDTERFGKENLFCKAFHIQFSLIIWAYIMGIYFYEMRSIYTVMLGHGLKRRPFGIGAVREITLILKYAT